MPAVWAIDEVDVPARVARAVAYVGIAGASGVIEPGGLKVQPLAVPGEKVRVMPGAASVLNRYPGGSLQAYALYEQVQQEIDIAPTTSAGPRTDLVIARVYDPEYATVADPGGTFEVIQGVPTGATGAYVEALPYPAEALARITVPASTATITAAMITDLRTLARPRQERRNYFAQVSSQQDLTPPAGAFMDWPASFRPSVPVPKWATHADIKVTLTGIYAITAAVAGVTRLTLGGVGVPDVQYDTPAATNPADPNTMVIVMGGTIPVAAMAGTSQTIKTSGTRLAGSGALRASVGRCSVLFEVEFQERAV
jgi:hypothetical protein